MRAADRSVDVYVHKLRSKLADALPEWRFIHTHFGFGYRFQRGAFTAFSQDGHDSVTGRAIPPASLGRDTHGEGRVNENRTSAAGARHDGVAGVRRRRVRRRRGGWERRRRLRRVDRGALGRRSVSTARRRSSRSPRPRPSSSTRSSPDVQITVGQSGTGGGFEKFCAGETDISDRLAPDRRRGGGPGLREERRQVRRGPDRQRRHRRRDEQGPHDRLPDRRPAQGALGAEGSKVASYSDIDAELPGHAGHALRAGHRLRHVRLLHRRDQRRGGRVARGLRGLRGRQPARDRRRRHRGRPRLLRPLLLRGERGQAQPGRRRRRRAAASSPTPRPIQDGSYKPLSRPLFMYPSDEGPRAARGQGVHGLRRRQPGGDRRGGADRRR